MRGRRLALVAARLDRGVGWSRGNVYRSRRDGGISEGDRSCILMRLGDGARLPLTSPALALADAMLSVVHDRVVHLVVDVALHELGDHVLESSSIEEGARLERVVPRDLVVVPLRCVETEVVGRRAWTGAAFMDDAPGLGEVFEELVLVDIARVPLDLEQLGRRGVADDALDTEEHEGLGTGDGLGVGHSGCGG